jgi:hypothetical protein
LSRTHFRRVYRRLLTSLHWVAPGDTKPRWTIGQWFRYPPVRIFRDYRDAVTAYPTHRVGPFEHPHGHHDGHPHGHPHDTGSDRPVFGPVDLVGAYLRPWSRGPALLTAPTSDTPALPAPERAEPRALPEIRETLRLHSRIAELEQALRDRDREIRELRRSLRRAGRNVVRVRTAPHRQTTNPPRTTGHSRS